MEAPDAVPSPAVPSPLPPPEPGTPASLGSTPRPDGTQFAVHAPYARRLTLALFQPNGAPAGELVLDPARHRSGDVWQMFVRGVRPGAQYGWRAEGGAADAAAHASDP